MKNKLLSICIPVYNRKDIFKYCLIEACESSMEFSDEVEIVISDNDSEDDLATIVDEVKKRYNSIDIIYNKNHKNIGACKNIIRVVEIASGKFCWVVGSDDFIKKDGVNTLINIIKQNIDISFICCNYDYVILNKLKSENNQYLDIHEQLKNKDILVEHKAPIWSDLVNKFDELIDPIFNNVFLGAIMTGIFKRSLWDKFEKSNVMWDGFNSLESIYPHCYVYANSFMGEKAYYCGTPIITVGEGTREWSTDTGNTFWESSLPLIYFNIFGDMINTYKNNGLDMVQYQKCKKSTATITGQYFFPIFFRKYILRKNIKDKENIRIFKVFKLYCLTPSFYKGVILGLINNCKNIIKHILKLFGYKNKGLLR